MQQHQVLIRAFQGTVIGHVDGDIFRLRRNRARHWLRCLNGWSIDESALISAKNAGARLVEIIDDLGTTWRAFLDTMLTDGVLVDLGFGKQRALPAHRWSVTRPGQLSLVFG